MVRSRPATYVAVLLFAASLGVFLVESFLCRWPAPHPLSSAEAFFTALMYIFVAVLAGATITRLLCLRSGMISSVPSSRFILASAIGWIWLPSVVLLSRQRSIAAPLVAGIAAAVMAVGLRRSGVQPHHPVSGEVNQPELFAQSMLTAPQERAGFLIALCVYGACYELHKESFSAASVLLALSVFVLTWKLTGDGALIVRPSPQGLRLARMISFAILLTTGLLLLRLSHGTPAGSLGDYLGTPPVHGASQSAARGVPQLAGFERIVLWPVPEKKKVVISPPLAKSFTGFNLNKPQTIRFDGAYWYFHPRGNSPGARAHIAHGSPLTVDIRSTNYVPLVMEAHQSLAAPIPLASCGEIQVMIENRDNARGAITVGLLLTDSASLGKPTFLLEAQPIVSTQPANFTVKSSPVSETLRFRIPDRPRIQQFDQLTVVFFPDLERPNAGAKIAVQQFELIPR